MDVVWSDYEIFDSRSMWMKTPSIYIIMTRLVRITGLEWAKIYKKFHSVLIWIPQKGTSRWCRNHTGQTPRKGLYIPRKVSGYSGYTSTVFNGAYTEQGKEY